MTKHFNFIISGAGPSGLAMAIAASQEGNSVLLIEKRKETESLRSHYITLSKSSLRFLRTLLLEPIQDNDKIFLEKLGFIDPHLSEIKSSNNINLPDLCVIKIKSIERYLRNQISKCQQINISYNSKISEVNLKQLSVLINKDKLATYEYLVEADGAHRALFKLLKGSIPAEEIKHPDINHPYHLRIHFLLESENNIYFGDSPNAFTFKHEFENQFYVGNFFFDLESLAKNVERGLNAVKVQFVGEIPKNIFLEKKLPFDFLFQLLEKHIFHALNFNPNELLIRECRSAQNSEKAMKHLNFFTSSNRTFLQGTTQPWPNELIIIGDAYNNPDYRATHGINDAFKHVQLIKKSLFQNSNIKHPSQLIEKSQSRLEYIHEASEFMISFFTLSKKDATKFEYRPSVYVDPVFGQY